MRCAGEKRGKWLLVGLWCVASACQGNERPAQRPDAGRARPANPPPASPPPAPPTAVDAGPTAVDAGSAPDVPCPTIVCEGRCVEPRTDPAHCGRCGRACAAGATCANGTCRPANRPDAGVVCAVGEVRCGEYCATLATDPLHCGRCRNQCGEGRVCVAGNCASNVATVRDAGPAHCTGGQVQCGGYCATLTNDPLHCGRCDNRCATNQICTSSRCTTPNVSDGGPTGPGCPPPRTQCGPYCTDMGADPFNCGRCGTRCPSGQVCVLGRCAAGENGTRPDAGPAVRCTSPETACGEYCVNLTNDPLNCGGCGTRCPAGRVCTAGRCAVPGTGGRPPPGTPRVPPGPAAQ